MGRQQLAYLLHRFTVKQFAKARSLLIIQHSQLRNTYMWKVLWAQAQETPNGGINRLHRKLMRQIVVFAAQSEVIVIG
jgi:hypothetical protein